MKRSRMALYWIIALLAIILALYYLSREPPPEGIINLIYLLTNYKLQ
ncbi:hypothetical protein GURASL_18180 [Geotalea uraniireducens]|uniref:Uncharacterized protein n=1 Tax=Geotalea uraniireducens TaxID=351604 RepID=A0ABM8EKH3_9BACT|nr:hypothetical protein GURASL_18180 [Geotalea uraniireducens]